MNSTVSVLSKIKNIVPELQRILPNLKFHEVGNADIDKQFRESHIIVADYDLFAPYIYELPQVKWVQGTWAGVDRLMEKVNPSNPPSYPITRYTGKHFGFLMSEYIVSNIVNFERNTFEMRENQKLRKWVTEGKIEEYRSIADLTIGILGVGNIGDRVAKTLNHMGAIVFGYGRTPTFNLEEHQHIAKYCTKDTLPQLLKSCDYVVNTMPHTEDTQGMLNGDVLENCKNKQTVFVNVGRGSIISEQHLVKALEKRWISGAILDVFETEPLKTDSALWNMPNVIITPHVSANSRARDVAEHLRDNLRYYQQELPIPATIDFSKGY